MSRRPRRQDPLKTTTADEPEHLLPSRRDAALDLAGLGGFWGGIAAGLVVAEAHAPSLALVPVFVAVGCCFVLMNARRQLDGRITGRSPRAWPIAYPSFRTQVVATLPSTVMAAAQRLRFNAIAVAVAMYSVLVIGLIALVSALAR